MMADTATDTTTDDDPLNNVGPGNTASTYTHEDVSLDPTTDTVEGRVQGIIAKNSAPMRSARTRATQGMQGRGLVNSSIAQGEGERQVYDAAGKWATPDAAAMQQAKFRNQEAANTEGQFNAAERNKFGLLNIQGEQDIAKIQETGKEARLNIADTGTEERLTVGERGLQERKAIADTGAQTRLNLGVQGINERLGIRASGVQERKTLAEKTEDEKLLISARKDADKALMTAEYAEKKLLQGEKGDIDLELQILKNDTNIDVTNLNNASKERLAIINNEYDALIESSRTAAYFYSQMATQMNEVWNNGDMTPEAKQVVIDKMMEGVEAGLAMIGSMTNVDINDVVFPPDARGEFNIGIIPGTDVSITPEMRTEWVNAGLRGNNNGFVEPIEWLNYQLTIGDDMEMVRNAYEKGSLNDLFAADKNLREQVRAYLGLNPDGSAPADGEVQMHRQSNWSSDISRYEDGRYKIEGVGDFPDKAAVDAYFAENNLGDPWNVNDYTKSPADSGAGGTWNGQNGNDNAPPGFASPDGDAATTMVETFRNTETGETWSSSTGGWTAPEGWEKVTGGDGSSYGDGTIDGKAADEWFSDLTTNQPEGHKDTLQTALDDGEFDHDPDLKAEVAEYLGSDSGGEYTGPEKYGDPTGGIGYNPISGEAYSGQPANLGVTLDADGNKEVTVDEWYKFQQREGAAGLRGVWRSGSAATQKQIFDVLTMGTKDPRLTEEQQDNIEAKIKETWPQGDPSIHEYYAGPEQYGDLAEGGLGYNPISGKAYQGEPASLGATLDDDGNRKVTIDEWIKYQQREGASGTSGLWRGYEPHLQKMIYDVLQMGVDDPRLTQDEKDIIKGLMTKTWPHGDPSTYDYSSGVISGAQTSDAVALNEDGSVLEDPERADPVVLEGPERADPVVAGDGSTAPTKYYGATDWRAAQDAWVAAGMMGTPPPGKGDPYWDQF